MFNVKYVLKIDRSIHFNLNRYLTIPANFIKTINVRTCAGIYDHLRTINPKLYKNAPNNGINLTVNYVDTGVNQSYDKIIVAVHGSADTYQTFEKIIENFSRKNVRIIAPNMPDFSHTRNTNYSFWHSNLERYCFLKDFLHQLNINSIDCLLGHSQGIQPVTSLCVKDETIKIKSIGMLSPHYMLHPFDQKSIKIAKFLTSYLKSKFAISILDLAQLNKSFFGLKLNSIEAVYPLLCVAYDEDVQQNGPDRIKKLNQMSIPGFILFGTNEKIIPQKTIKLLHDLLNLDNIIEISKDDANLLPDLTKIRLEFTSYLLINCGHFPHAKYSNVTNRLIESYLKMD